MLGLANGRDKFTRMWDSESRFIVAGVNELSISQQTDIFEYFSKFRIYNCIILSQETYVVDKEHSRQINVNDLDTGLQLGAYTWFPYKRSGFCTEVNDITLLDSWVISAQGHFTKKNPLFSRKISNSLNECPTKAVVGDVIWDFTTKYFNHTDTNGGVVRFIEGMEINLFLFLLQQMNVSFIHVP